MTERPGWCIKLMQGDACVAWMKASTPEQLHAMLDQYTPMLGPRSRIEIRAEVKIT